MIKNLVKFRFLVIIVFFILSVISCEENKNSNPFIGTWNGLDNYGDQIELIITETKWVLFYNDNNTSITGTYNYKGNTGTFLEPISGMGGVGTVSGNIFTATISEFTFILTNDGTSVGTFQIRITEVPNIYMDSIHNYFIGCHIGKNNTVLAMSKSNEYETGGTDENQWISFLLYKQEGNPFTNIYYDISGNFDVHFYIYDLTNGGFKHIMTISRNKMLNVNEINVINFNSFKF